MACDLFLVGPDVYTIVNREAVEANLPDGARVLCADINTFEAAIGAATAVARERGQDRFSIVVQKR